MVAAQNFLPALAGYDQYIQDPIVQQMARMLSEAPAIQPHIVYG